MRKKFCACYAIRMDAFNVPKKVNRHVLKALSILGNVTTEDSVSTSQILEQVKFQMRNLVPVPNIDMVIQKSLKNLSDIGLIDRAGPRKFAVTHSCIPPIAPKPRCVDRKCFTTGVSVHAILHNWGRI